MRDKMRNRSPSPRAATDSLSSSTKFRSIVSDVFDGQILSSVECLTCNLVQSILINLPMSLILFIYFIISRFLTAWRLSKIYLCQFHPETNYKSFISLYLRLLLIRVTIR